MLNRTTRVLVLMVASLVVACGGDDDGPADTNAPDTSVDSGTDSAIDSSSDSMVDAEIDTADRPSIEIGTGLSRFIEVEEEGETELVMGPQGGWHVDVALRIRNLQVDDLEMEINGFDAETDEVIAIRVERVLSSRRVIADGDSFLRLGDLLVFMIVAAEDIVDRRVRIEATCSQEDGLSASDTLVVRVVDNE